MSEGKMRPLLSAAALYEAGVAKQEDLDAARKEITAYLAVLDVEFKAVQAKYDEEIRLLNEKTNAIMDRLVMVVGAGNKI